MGKKYQIIKENMLEKAMELWGIENPRMVDPVIELFLDVFSYEFSKIEQDIQISDAKLLERISKILVQENWSLPLPSHALLRAIPAEGIHKITRNSQFFTQKIIQGAQHKDLFFTPLLTHHLIQGHVACTIQHNKACFFDERGREYETIATKENKKIKDYTLWVGIDIDDKLLGEINEIPLALILRNSQIATYLRLVKFYDSENNQLQNDLFFENIAPTKEHYFNTVLRYYRNYLHTLVLPEKKSKQSIIDKFTPHFQEEDIEDFTNKLFWIKIVLPVAFTAVELDNLDVRMNTFPVVNRKTQYKQHNLQRNGKIISLRPNNSYFLNVEWLQDNEGRNYNNTLANDIDNLDGTYSLYAGELEQFDERNAKAMLEQMIQTIRQEGSSFSAIGYDLLNTYLEDINNKLDLLERKINVGYKNISEHNNRQYLLTLPYKEAAYLECRYWVTNAKEANDMKTGKMMEQFQTSGLVPQSIRLQTDTVGGGYKNDGKEKISYLRYGLLSKDRIVSIEDVKEFVRKNIGKTVARVEVRSGVGISPNKNQGLIRTTKVDVYLTENNIHTSENKKRLSDALQLELEQKSVHNLPYSVLIH